MKTPRAQFIVLSWMVLTAVGALAQETAISPVEFPKGEAFAPLWERSLFTTKDLPAADAPAGPSFADNLGLSGMYEIDGEIVVLIVDKTTSQVHQAKMGSENALGVKVRKISGEITDPKVRVQLQKGDQVGWVTGSDGMTDAPAEAAPVAAAPSGAQPGAQPHLAPGAATPGLQTRLMPAGAAAAGLLLPQNAPVTQGSASIMPAARAPGLLNQAPPAHSASMAAPPPILPQSPPAAPPPVAVPPVPTVDGVPLPPN